MGAQNSRPETNEVGSKRGIAIEKLKPTIEEQDLRLAFQEFGPISLVVLRQRNGYIVFSNERSAQRALYEKQVWIKGTKYTLHSCNIKFTGPMPSSSSGSSSGSSSSGTSSSSSSSSASSSATSSSSSASSTPSSASSSSNAKPTLTNRLNPPRSAHFKIEAIKPKPLPTKEQQAKFRAEFEAQVKASNAAGSTRKIPDPQLESIVHQITCMSTENRKLTAQMMELKEENVKLCDEVTILTVKNCSLEDSRRALCDENKNYELILKEFQNQEHQLSSSLPTTSSFSSNFASMLMSSKAVISGDECCLCLEVRANIALIKCGHVCLCDKCSTNWKLKMKSCPVCRKPIESILKLYF